MLCLNLNQGEYLTIGEDVVVQLYGISWDRCKLMINAPKEIPVLRGKVLERTGGQWPECVFDGPLWHRKEIIWNRSKAQALAAMRLLLQEEPRPELEGELLKIEQYVEMVLGYLRLGSGTTDYVFRSCELDALIRQSVRKYARLFILKKISLDFRETGKTVLTDEKWLSFVIEQLLSNAVKYTPEGGCVRIYGDGETLVITDSGIGIQPEDLPRVFEKGFTGFNGREDKKSTGIGLYLCRQVLDRLNHGISISSRPGQGTLVRLDLSRQLLFLKEK